jgi:TetR/AcrR family transcriptional regulator, cholesterol catabolism regulator
MAAGGVYAHYQTKEQLLFELLDEFMRDLVGSVAPVAAADMEPEAKIREALRAHIAYLTQRRKLWGILHSWRVLTGDNREAIQRQRLEYAELWRSIVTEGIATGRFAPRDAEMVRRFVHGVADSPGVWFNPDGSLTVQELTDAYANLLLFGLLRLGPGERAATD